jgi:hypothetical protein
MSSSINVMLLPGQFMPLGTYKKVAPFATDFSSMPYAYMAQPPPMVKVDPTSSLSLPSYASHGVNVAFMFSNLSAPVAMYTQWTV